MYCIIIFLSGAWWCHTVFEWHQKSSEYNLLSDFVTSISVVCSSNTFWSGPPLTSAWWGLCLSAQKESHFDAVPLERPDVMSSTLFQRAAPVKARGPELSTNTSAPNKDETAWIKVLDNAGKSLFSPPGYFVCLACPHRSLWVSWRAIRARQTLSGYHTEDVTWGQTRSLWIENLLRLSSLICFVLSRDAFECDSFAVEMHPGADGEETIVCLFFSRSEPLLASIVKSQCCVSHHSSTPVGAKY